jgi:hypothetical protein
MREMNWLRRLIAAIVLVVFVAVAWIWWNHPTPTDLAQYAPADSLAYLEANDIIGTANAITSTDAWRQFAPLLKLGNTSSRSWVTRVMRWTGIGPTRTVVASRAQVALVMLNLGTSEEGETLKVKPDAAILIETHTASWRIRPVAESALSDVARSIYGNPSFTKSTANGMEFLAWHDATGSRQIIATIDDTLIIVGNTELAVATCLMVRRGQRPSLIGDVQLQLMRRRLNASQALAFGYVSSGNAAKLAAFAVPLLLGREPNAVNVERIVTTVSAKLLGSIGWSASLSNGLIEDRYLFSLQPAVVNRLQPHFHAATIDPERLKQLLDGNYAATIYRLESPLDAWTEVQNAVLAQLDALSAVLFRSVSKAVLSNNLIEDPERFLALVGPPLITVRLSSTSERSVLVAKVRDRAALRELLSEHFRKNTKTTEQDGTEVLDGDDDETSAVFYQDYFLVGPSFDVRICAENLAKEPNNTMDQRHTFKLSNSSSVIVTYTDDRERIRGFLMAVVRASSNSGLAPSPVEELTASTEPSYSITETTLVNEGFERRTRSAFGQFSTLATLIFPEGR